MVETMLLIIHFLLGLVAAFWYLKHTHSTEGKITTDDIGVAFGLVIFGVASFTITVLFFGGNCLWKELAEKFNNYFDKH